jgi:hypothetical protein
MNKGILKQLQDLHTEAYGFAGSEAELFTQNIRRQVQPKASRKLGKKQITTINPNTIKLFSK